MEMNSVTYNVRIATLIPRGVCVVSIYISKHVVGRLLEYIAYEIHRGLGLTSNWVHLYRGKCTRDKTISLLSSIDGGAMY